MNTSFAVRTAAGTPARFVLEQVVERPVTKNVEQFSLMFRAPDATAVPDGTHAFRHPALGDFNLFIVPVGASNGRRPLYQACFSRHLSHTTCGAKRSRTRRPVRGRSHGRTIPGNDHLCSV